MKQLDKQKNPFRAVNTFLNLLELNLIVVIYQLTLQLPCPISSIKYTTDPVQSDIVQSCVIIDIYGILHKQGSIH